MGMGLALSLAGAASAVALSGIGSSIGIGLVGQASAGVMSEDPKKFGKLMLLAVLPGTQGIYGFIAAFWVIFIKLNLLGAESISPTIQQGWQIFFACLPIAIAGLVSAIHQGKVCTAGVGLTAKQPTEVGKALVMGVLVEFYAILGLVITIFCLMGIKLA